jgi:hypothetical protein
VPPLTMTCAFEAIHVSAAATCPDTRQPRVYQPRVSHVSISHVSISHVSISHVSATCLSVRPSRLLQRPLIELHLRDGCAPDPSHLRRGQRTRQLLLRLRLILHRRQQNTPTARRQRRTRRARGRRRPTPAAVAAVEVLQRLLPRRLLLLGGEPHLGQLDRAPLRRHLEGEAFLLL